MLMLYLLTSKFEPPSTSDVGVSAVGEVEDRQQQTSPVEVKNIRQQTSRVGVRSVRQQTDSVVPYAYFHSPADYRTSTESEAVIGRALCDVGQ